MRRTPAAKVNRLEPDDFLLRLANIEMLKDQFWEFPDEAAQSSDGYRVVDAAGGSTSARKISLHAGKIVPLTAAVQKQVRTNSNVSERAGRMVVQVE